jgi:hypothetical protein
VKWALLGLLTGCASLPGGSDGGSAVDAGSEASASGQGLFGRLAGLWSGQAGQTPLGSFPEMNMDFRAADEHWLFGRVDLDAQNSLRYGFAYEDVAGGPSLVYRNGGYFQGTLRDLTVVLNDADEDAGTYHFCAQPDACMFVNDSCIPETGGCGFVDALFTFSAPDQLVFNAHVNGQEHLIWTAARKETRQLPTPFPVDATPQPADAGWPAMPQASLTVSWTAALAKPTGVWIILSETPCGSLGSLGWSCTPSRALMTQAPAGATSATLLFDQLLAGAYNAVALVDAAGTFAMTLAPAPGDSVSDPAASIVVPASGQATATLPIVYVVP